MLRNAEDVPKTGEMLRNAKVPLHMGGLNFEEMYPLN